MKISLSGDRIRCSGDQLQNYKSKIEFIIIGLV